ncbi:MAG: FAD-dependent thymidylate synthase [Thaumarchaeota archaeon]|nr:FAD-dependent thymidylate synthase [Nitrososphaerota archaeon]
MTNVDKPIFVLKNLPEVVKGTVFSRYSRTVKSLRRVLLDEFVTKLEGGGTSDRGIDTKRAEDFYERVLNDYGDDSVAELAGVHLACEDVSMLATKVIEDNRIGLSPLEKSTRYVLFNQKVNDEYRVYKDLDIMNSRHADLYLETVNYLFDTYSRLYDPLTKYVKEKVPADEGVSDRAYASSIKANVCDNLRGLLPSASLTNLGLYGNGRAFEYLLIKMYAHPLNEMRALSSMMHEELNKVIPSFLRRANDEKGKEYQRYLTDTRNNLATYMATRQHVGGSKKEASTKLVYHYPDDETDMIASMIYPYIDGEWTVVRQWIREMDTQEKEKVVQLYLGSRTNRRHKPGRALENSSYFFEIVGNYGMYRDLQRHRVLTQEKQEFSTKNGYDIPSTLIEAGYKKDFEEAMKRSEEAYSKIASDLPRQAQYVVALAWRIRWYMQLNLREAYHLIELRSSKQGHPDYRRVAQSMFRQISAVHPLTTKYMKFVDMNDYQLGRLEAEKRIDKKRVFSTEPK